MIPSIPTIDDVAREMRFERAAADKPSDVLRDIKSIRACKPRETMSKLTREFQKMEERTAYSTGNGACQTKEFEQ